MKRRRARRLRGHATGKTVKLKQDKKVDKMSFKFGQVASSSSSSSLSLVMMALIMLGVTLAVLVAAAEASSNQDGRPRLTRRASTRQSRKLGNNNLHFHEASASLSSTSDDSPDPMEACYLANNRASETLTISESTPVGTIVGELMVNGEVHSSPADHGSIVLSIDMPNFGDSPYILHNDVDHRPHLGIPDGLASSISRSGSQAKPDDRLARDNIVGPHSGSNHTGAVSYKSLSLSDSHPANTTNTGRRRVNSVSKNARDLSHLIDLMPPLSIEQGTKRLILAKKLDRENLDKYMGSYQSSINSLSQSSSASLTVHIRCQLKESIPNINYTETKATGNSSALPREVNISSTRKLSKSSTNSILIPIHLIVTDENDNWPNFIGWPYIIDLNETAQVGSLLQGNEIVAVDNDQQGPLSTIEYSIVPGSFWSDSFGFLNPLDSRSLIVKDNRLFDYESQSKLMLKVMARDQGDPPNWAITSLYINLLDQDDLNPVFSEDKYFGLIKENRPGEKIDVLPTRMVAHDGDRTISSPVYYAFHMKTNHSIHFDLDSDLGHLTLKKTLPTEVPHTKQSFCLLIKASQLDNNQRFTLTAINLKLAEYTSIRSSDASNSSSKESPKFSHSNYTVEVSEAALVGSTILTASASHHNDEVVNYQLLDDESDYLAIEKTTGRLTINKSLDYEMFRQLTVRILATTERKSSDASESGSATYPKLACDIARVNINVINYNDYTPEFSHEQYNFQLSISDLIANFEPTARVQLDADDESSLVGQTDEKMSHRLYGGIELDDIVEELEYKAIQLGQVYCADRDYGDRVSLKLTGSKASLFHLSQDGRLYLPLVNVSTSSEFHRNQANTQDSDSRQSKWGSKSSRIINNQFLMSRAFSASARRSDSAQPSNSLDRSYLNYLLGELSNLGRLRLKVHATDGGQPEARQSTALIVITVVSIDNFIIQRGSSPSQYGGPAPGTTIAQGTSKEIKANRDEPSEHSSQVMMIPSMNGREFVHIDSDIIGNLLASGKNFTPPSRVSDLKLRPPSLPDMLDSAPSNTVISSLNPNGSSHSASNKRHPPGLLLVDNEGAKFVAMPAAIEMYNQQVQEAAGQQTRQKLRLDKYELDHDGAASTIWSLWSSKLGLPVQSDNWSSVSATILLHIVIILAIIGLATRIRSYVSPQSAGNNDRGSDGFNPDREGSHGRWPRRISNLGSFFVPKSASSDSASDILNNHQSAASIYGNVANSGRIDQHNYASYQNPIGASIESNQTIADNNSRYRQQQVVSSGVVVSAMSNGMRHSPRAQQASSCDESKPVSPEVKNQQNLFDHLKLTLNRMMDNSETNVGLQVSMRPLDSDVVAYEDQRDRQLDDRARCRETSELQSHQQNQHGKKFIEERTAISTFVGGQTSQRSPTQAATVTGELIDSSTARRPIKVASSTVVSINVVAPPGGGITCSPRSNQESTINQTNHNSSSSSSVVSLGGTSVASSLSNKISEAVGRATSGDRVTGSDASSLNSSILLQGCASSSSSCVYGGKSTSTSDYTRRGAQTTSKPPAPPPLPPPPPSQIRATRTRDSSSGYSESPPSMSPKYANGAQVSSVNQSQPAPSSRRQAIPENPIYSKLKRETIPDQAIDRVRSSPGGSMSTIAKKPNSPSVMGRREARDQAVNGARVRPPSPPPMPGVSSGGKRAIATNKTVSPTTSVDRGYESFQSYEQSRVVPHAGTRQFSSLQDYEPANEMMNPGARQSCDQQYDASLPVHSTSDATTGNIGRRLGKSAAQYPNSNKIWNPYQTLRSSQLGRRVRTSTGRRTLGNTTTTSRVDCDTEDDDFYYCCSDLSHADSTHHQLPPAGGGLLSDYASHTYKQPAPTPSSLSRTAKLKRSINGRHAASDTKGTVGTLNFSNDLILYPCEYQQQHQENPVANMSQVCDMAQQCRRAPVQNQYSAGDGGQRRFQYQQQQQQVPTLSRDRHTSAAAKRPAGPHPSHSVMSDSYPSSGPGKKQLTWSDQVETDPY